MKRSTEEFPKASLVGDAERVDINLGHACNHRCIFCMQSGSDIDQKRWVPLDRLMSELEYYAKEKGVRGLGLLGGEPTLYPHLEKALDKAKELGYQDVTLNSNGLRLGEWEFAKMAVEKGINRYCLSIHSEDPDIEDFLSGRKGSFLRKMRAIRNLTRLRNKVNPELSISVNAVLNKKNLPTFDRFLGFYNHLGIRDIRFNFIRPEGGAENRKDIVCTFTEAMPYLMELVALNEEHLGIHLTFGEIPYCAYPKPFFENEKFRKKYIGEYIDKRTFVSTFGNQPGKLSDKTGTQRFIWQELRMNELKSFVAACESCEWKEVCGGVWTNYLKMYGEDEFSPIIG